MAGIIVPEAIVLSVAGQDLAEGNHIVAVPKQYVGLLPIPLSKANLLP